MPSRHVILSALCLLIGGPAMAFDIEAHRGGRALLPENTLPAFANALSMGVDTLELDVGVTKDGAIVVSHERSLNPDLARDAGGVYVTTPGTPLFDLTLDEVRKYDVGQIRADSAYAKQFPDQHPVAGTQIPTLKQVIALVRKSGDPRVRLNIETKIDPDHPLETPDPQSFVTRLLALLEAEKFTGRVMIQSFDCSAGQGHRLDRELQSGRPRRIAAAHDQGGGRNGLVALFRRRRSDPRVRGARSRIARRGLDRQQAGGHGAHDRDRRGRDHLRPSRPAAQGGRRQGHRPARRLSGRAIAWLRDEITRPRAIADRARR
jgi:glycerophosphoryl diester phosphodiesterase